MAERHRAVPWKVAVAGGGDRSREPGRIIARRQPPRRRPRQQHQSQPRERRPPPRSPLAWTGRDERRGRQPVVEHRLLPALLVVEVRRQPVAIRHHLARGLRVEPFVRISDRRAPNAEEEGEGGDEGE